MISPYMRALARKVFEFANSHGIYLNEDEALDVTGHLICDDLKAVAQNSPPDWHCILWNRDEAAMAEVYSLGHTAADALAAVTTHAAVESHDLDVIEVVDDELHVYSAGKLYARIRRPQWTEPNPITYRRMATLVSALRVQEGHRLYEALSTLPAWQVEPYDSSPTWFPERRTAPRLGEFLPRLSANMTIGAPSEQNLLPMWPTPSAMAATLHKQLAERAGGRLKLAHCQEGLARMLEFKSWQVLLARFRANNFPQVMVQTLGDGNEEPGLRFYKGPVELLACTYDLALRRKAAGASPLFVQVDWYHSFRLSLTHRLLSRSELHEAVKARCPMPSDLSDEKSLLWDEVACAVAEQAQEWTGHGDGLDVLGAWDEDIEAAGQKLMELGYS